MIWVHVIKWHNTYIFNNVKCSHCYSTRLILSKCTSPGAFVHIHHTNQMTEYCIEYYTNIKRCHGNFLSSINKVLSHTHVYLNLGVCVCVKLTAYMHGRLSLSNLRALKISMLYEYHIYMCMGEIFCAEFRRVSLKFHTKYLTHTLKDVDFIHRWKYKSS